MIAMQYKVKLPNDYDMNIIRKRVMDNGHKTDGFEDLLFKAYLIDENPTNSNSLEYSPLYIWKNNNGMNKFIFEGFFDNILKSFGWQNINIGIPLMIDLSENFSKSTYLIEHYHDIQPTENLTAPSFSSYFSNYTGRVLIYNPDKWKWVEFYFYTEKPLLSDVNNRLYEILHIST